MRNQHQFVRFLNFHRNTDGVNPAKFGGYRILRLQSMKSWYGNWSRTSLTSRSQS